MSNSGSQHNSVKIDAVNPTVLLVQLCIKVLKARSPAGMTTRELAAALDNEVMEGFSGIASSILSSKLNAVFRRCHNDSATPTDEQLRELPITRTQSEELPRRLVYRYTPPASEKAANVAEEEESEFELESLEADQPDQSISNNAKPFKSHEADQEGPKDDEPSADEQPTEPLTPKDESHGWSSAKRRKVITSKDESNVHISRTPPHYNDSLKENPDPKNVKQPTASPSFKAEHRAGVSFKTSGASGDLGTQSGSRKAQAPSEASRFNIYYDIAGFDIVAAALDCGSNASQSKFSLRNSFSDDNENWTDFEYPTPLALSELDQMIC